MTASFSLPTSKQERAEGNVYSFTTIHKLAPVFGKLYHMTRLWGILSTSELELSELPFGHANCLHRLPALNHSEPPKYNYL